MKRKMLAELGLSEPQIPSPFLGRCLSARQSPAWSADLVLPGWPAQLLPKPTWQEGRSLAAP